MNLAWLCGDVTLDRQSSETELEQKQKKEDHAKYDSDSDRSNYDSAHC